MCSVTLELFSNLLQNFIFKKTELVNGNEISGIVPNIQIFKVQLTSSLEVVDM